MKSLQLKKNEERRLLAGNLWVYSNEIDTDSTPLSKFGQGELVKVKSYNGKNLGIGYINPHTLLCGRLLTRDTNTEINIDFFKTRIERALALRQTCFRQPFYRLIYSESDELPGLIVDRFADDLVVQITTAGMENLKEIIITALIEMLKPKSILLRNDSGSREIEGLPKDVSAVHGAPPRFAKLQEQGVNFNIPIWDGQKTGWFFDQSMNRNHLQNYVKDKTILDVFSYIGAWGIAAAVGGAREVTCIDSSQTALTILNENALLNNVAAKIKTIKDDAFATLKNLQSDKQKFDVIILDPPAFIKRRKDIKEGVTAYLRLHEAALKILNPNGILFSTSCSQHLSREMLGDIIRRGGINTKLDLRIIESLHQAPDHPIHPAIPETEYLKGFIIFLA